MRLLTLLSAVLLRPDSTADFATRLRDIASLAPVLGQVAKVNQLVLRVSPLLPAPPKGVTFNALHSVLADIKTERW